MALFFDKFRVSFPSPPLLSSSPPIKFSALKLFSRLFPLFKHVTCYFFCVIYSHWHCCCPFCFLLHFTIDLISPSFIYILHSVGGIRRRKEEDEESCDLHIRTVSSQLWCSVRPVIVLILQKIFPRQMDFTLCTFYRKVLILLCISLFILYVFLTLHCGEGRGGELRHYGAAPFWLQVSPTIHADTFSFSISVMPTFTQNAIGITFPLLLWTVSFRYWIV